MISTTVHQEYNTSMPVVVDANLRSKTKDCFSLWVSFYGCLLFAKGHKKKPSYKCFNLDIITHSFHEASEHVRILAPCSDRCGVIMLMVKYSGVVFVEHTTYLLISISFHLMKIPCGYALSDDDS